MKYAHWPVIPVFGSVRALKASATKSGVRIFEEKADVSECVEAIKKNSRNFAKRQYTWFRNQLEVQWYDVKEPNWKEQCMRQLQEWRKQ